MRKIGNILTNKNFDAEGIYNVVSSKDELISGIPTLVIGWDFVKENYPNANIINWKIDDDTYWTFGNRERRSAYELRTDEFKEIAIDRFIKSVKYEPFNVLVESNERKREFFDFMANNTADKKIYTRNGMVYIYVPVKETVYGISLRDIEYINKDANKFLSKMYGSLNAESVNVKASENITYGMLSDLKNCIYIVPCLCYDND